MLGGKQEQVFAPPKGGKLRDVPLLESVALRLAAHIEAVGSPELTLPWRTLDGPPHTARLLFSTCRKPGMCPQEG
ncbi:hypothetical protein [Streptosporangium sp. NPDC087985]|uniref:hypothetical protein n=1 Tax=Streptosporangium sp. NPDC087985 TaxID=3366196 RepID=UPI0037FE225E